MPNIPDGDCHARRDPLGAVLCGPRVTRLRYQRRGGPLPARSRPKCCSPPMLGHPYGGKRHDCLEDPRAGADPRCRPWWWCSYSGARWRWTASPAPCRCRTSWARPTTPCRAHAPFDHPLHHVTLGHHRRAQVHRARPAERCCSIWKSWCCTDLKREDKIFYYTTCGWMMELAASSSAVGATWCWPTARPSILTATAWDLVDEPGISVFGAAP